MLRLLFYLIAGYLVYLYFIRPLLSGYRQKPPSSSPKESKDNIRHTPAGTKGDYIDYEEIK